MRLNTDPCPNCGYQAGEHEVLCPACGYLLMTGDDAAVFTTDMEPAGDQPF